MADQLMPTNQNISLVVHEIGDLLAAARSNVARQVNNELLSTYWNIGRIIAEYEQTVPERADYGKQTLKELSKALTNEFGKGFSVSNIQFMRRFYQTYQIQQTASVKLSWSHYCELLSISDPDKRSFYEKEAVNANWSVRELKRQIDSSLFERLLLSRGDANKEQVLALAENGIEIAEPADIIRDPYVFEFLGIPEDKPMLESDLERALVQQIEKFLLELGRGFMFVGTQQRVTINNTHYYVDMVFYNKILRAYVLIELKTTKLTPEAAGQINMYLNYYASEVNDPDDNPPIGIILCTEKDSITAEYALGGLSNNVFASRYLLYMPNKEQLIAQVEAVLEKRKENGNES
jgi:predicted nuclease of restriction endonuclease-like (RecB) superfamily